MELSTAPGRSAQVGLPVFFSASGIWWLQRWSELARCFGFWLVVAKMVGVGKIFGFRKVVAKDGRILHGPTIRRCSAPSSYPSWPSMCVSVPWQNKNMSSRDRSPLKPTENRKAYSLPNGSFCEVVAKMVGFFMLVNKTQRALKPPFMAGCKMQPSWPAPFNPDPPFVTPCRNRQLF